MQSTIHDNDDRDRNRDPGRDRDCGDDTPDPIPLPQSRDRGPLPQLPVRIIRVPVVRCRHCSITRSDDGTECPNCHQYQSTTIGPQVPCPVCRHRPPLTPCHLCNARRWLVQSRLEEWLSTRSGQNWAACHPMEVQAGGIIDHVMHELEDRRNR